MEPVVPKHIDDLIGFDPKGNQAEYQVDKSKQNKEETKPTRPEDQKANKTEKKDCSEQSNDCLSIC